MSLMIAFRSRTFGLRTVWRLKASSCRVSEAARSPAIVDRLDHGRQRILRSQLRAENVAVGQNDGEQIVEVVSHSAGELPDGVHFSRLPQLVFQALSHSFRVDSLSCVAEADGEQLPFRQPNLGNRGVERKLLAVGA